MHATLFPAPVPGAPAPVLERVLTDDDGTVVHVVRLHDAAPAHDAWRVTRRWAGSAAGSAPAVVQLVWFDGPRDARWLAAHDRAATDRLWPAVADLPGLVDVHLLEAPDGAVVVLTAGVDRAVLEEGGRRVMSTQLLPGEDPALLPGPDRVVVLDVAPAPVPAGAR